MIGTTELIVIVAVVLLLFGATAIPKLARSLGEAKKEFSKAIKEEDGGKAEPSGKESGKKDGQA